MEEKGALFTLLPSSATGVTFANRVTDTREFNVFTYRNFYNGGGAAIGDLNGDSLPEIVLTSNQDGPRLYLNLGGFRFRDVTKDAGIAESGRWTTGVTLADVNGDGKLDIYICHAGLKPGPERANTLYINQGVRNGVPAFREMAAAYGIADTGYSTQAAFFDYDGDGDLDLFLIRNSPRAVATMAVRNQRTIRDPLGGHRLYRNDNGHFHDVSEAAGIYGPEIGFGLGIAIGDLNRDGKPDVYVANDFFERDYLYLNNGNGTFQEVLDTALPVSSYFSMGVDIADIDNDGWPDIYTSDMLPEDDYRLKTTQSFEPWQLYQAKAREGFDHQLMHNMLQHNNRNGTFSDVAWQGGVARTDWSWAALIADFDLDGNKDIFVANGLARDVTQQDYLAFLANDQTMLAATRGKHVDFMSLINAMSSTKLPDYVFRNNGDLTFTNASAAWGVSRPSFSNGAAYGDLDGDGAPDLVVNNVNDEAFIYRNNARTQLPNNHYLRVTLVGDSANRFAVGARVTAFASKTQFVQELEPTRGFQSSVDYTLTFGVGAADTLRAVTVDWPDGRYTELTGVPANRHLTIRQRDAKPPMVAQMPVPPLPLLQDVTRSVDVDFIHHENDFVDFDREPLIPKMVSREGPLVAVCDVNGDGLDDFFIGGARGQPSALYLQRANGTFTATNQALFATDSISEDLGAAFFDANGDGHLDLYVVTGGNEYSILAPALEDRLYLGDGRGNFTKTAGRLPSLPNSGSRVAISKDYVFVGGRVVPGRYGVDPPSTLLRNDGGGRGNFTDVTAQVAPDLAQVGMVTDALWIDVDGDNRLDLVVVGEWMPITIFHNTGTRLARVTTKGLEHSTGWWNRIITGDFNGDGRPDFVVGNLGLNSRLHAAPAEPARMYVKDLDRSGFLDQIVTLYERATLDAPQAVSLPLSLRDELTAAMPSLKPRYPKYSDYAGQTVEQIFGKGLDGAVVKQAETFATAIALSNRDGSYTLVSLAPEAQIAPVYGILAADVDHDGKLDLLLAGNFEGVQPEIGSMMASYGLMLRGDGRGRFTPLRAAESGFVVPGEARDIERLRTRRGDLYIVARNNDRPLFFRPLR